MKKIDLALLQKAGQNQRGVTLLEFLVAVIVLSLGLLGLAGLQISGLRSVESSAERSVAVMLTSSIVDTMRVSVKVRGDVPTLYNYAYTPNQGCALAPDGSFTRAELFTWLQEIQSNLGDGSCGSIACDAAGACTITVIWRNRDVESDSDSAAAEFNVQTRVQL